MRPRALLNDEQRLKYVAYYSKPTVVEANTAVLPGCARPWRTVCAAKNPPIIEDCRSRIKRGCAAGNGRGCLHGQGRIACTPTPCIVVADDDSWLECVHVHQ